MTKSSFMISSDSPRPAPDSLPIPPQALFAMVAEHTHNAALVTDPDYRILWANPAFTRITGYTLEEARGRHPAEFLRAADSDPDTADEIRAAVEQRRSFHVVIRNRRKDGSPYWVDLEGQPIRDADGRVVAFLVVATDVSQHVAHEAALARNEELLNQTQRIARIGSWEYDPATQVCRWSAETFRIYGLPLADAPPGIATSLSCYVEAHRPIVEAAFNQCVAMGVPFDVEAQLRRADGRETWVRCIGNAKTEGDRVVRVAGAVQDIDERKRAELEVSRLADRISLAARGAGIGIWEYDFISQKLIWDDVMLRLYGVERHAFTGRFSFWENAVHPEDRARARAVFDRTVAGAGDLDIEFRIRLPDGEIRHIKGHIRVVRDRNQSPLCAYGVNYDITRERAGERALRASEQNLLRLNADLQIAIDDARRLADEAKAANRAKSAFLATISHEIRTPLNGIIGMTGILADTPLDADQRDYLRTLRLSGESLLTLINDTLDYSKIEAGHIELERTPFRLVDCIDEAVGLVEPQAHKKNLSIARLVAADLPRLVEGDPARLRQILVNLLGNAVKFTDHGGVLVEVSIDDATADEVALAFNVIDTGIGIPRDKQARLFEHFFQVDASITRTHGGTGLGLAISKRLAGLMGGTITVASEAGRGSTFSVHIRLPVLFEEAPLDEVALQDRFAGRSLLVVAEPPLRDRIETLARRAGLTVATATDAAGALDRLARDRACELVVSDPAIPGMDGLEFARRLQSHGLGPVPMLTLNRIGSLSDATAPVFHRLIVSMLGPKQPAPSAAPGAPEAPRLADTMPLKILMAEDNPVNQRVAQLTLRHLGYEIEIAPDGASAVAALGRRPFDVILMDVQMPGMDGLEATRRIRENPAHQSRPWIIALTAGAFEEDRLNAFRAGMNDFLSKPLRTDRLQTALRLTWESLQALGPDERV